MSDDATASALERIAHHDAQAAFHTGESTRWKIFVNGADELAGREPRFPDVTLPSSAVAPMMPARASARGFSAGEFLGSPFATAAKVVLQARFDAGGKASPASVDDIREALLQGTYNFGTANAEQQKQSIRISLGKNSGVFVKLPNTDLFGLLEWYPGLKKPGKARVRANGEKDSATSAGPDEAGDEGAAEPPAADNPT
jgi:hypothetical protein